jgi:glyceraldehyde 3-phosphate dehydrogenase
VDLTFQASRNTSKEEIDDILKAAAAGPLKGILEINNRPLVSIDFNHNPASSIYEAPSTKVMNGNFVKVLSWYDNEWGFSNRMLDTSIALFNAK